MKLNKKLLTAALAGALIVTGGVGTFADGTNDAPGKTDAQKIDEAQAKAKKQLDDAGVPFEQQKEVLAYPNNVYNIEQKTKEILAAKEKSDKELAKTELGKAKLAAKAELKKEGYHLGLYDEAINNATSLYDIEQVKEKVRANKSLKTLDDYNKEQDAKTRKLTIDEWLKLQKEKEDKKPEDKKPGEDKKPEDKKPGEDKKPEDKKTGEDKKPEDKKTGEDKKPEDKKPGEDKKPENKKSEKEDKKKPAKPAKKEKKNLPKAGAAAEAATIAAAAMATMGGAYLSLKKRK